MKHAYFTSKTIEQQAEDFRNQVPRKMEINFTDRSPALLILDMQEYFLDPGSHAFIPSAPAILANINALATAFKQHGLPVIFTQHTNTPENAGMMSKWWHHLITPDHPLVSITPQLDTVNAEVLEKHQYDAFHQTDLEGRLLAKGITDLVICGVVAHLCCETTARAGFVHGFRIWFTIDATASYTAELHLSALRNLAHGFSVPVLSSEIISAL